MINKGIHVQFIDNKLNFDLEAGSSTMRLTVDKVVVFYITPAVNKGILPNTPYQANHNILSKY